MIRTTIFITISLLVIAQLSLSEVKSNGDALCPAGMSFIAAGEFLAGWDGGEPDERPERVDFTQSYCIDEYEYPNVQGGVPKDALSFDEAEKICAGIGKRMCTEVEWERACRGPQGTIYTHAQKYEKGDCNLNGEASAPSGSFPKCRNDFGVWDMTGNLWEWADGVYSAESPWPLVKGGSWQKGALFSSCYARFTQPSDVGDKGMGFRCCSSPGEPAVKYEKSCAGGRPQLQARKMMLRMKREPGVTQIFYIDDTDVKRKHTTAYAVIFGAEDSKIFRIDVSGGKPVSKEAKFSIKDADDLVVEYRDPLLQKNAPVNSSGCWACGGRCIYIYKNGSETWTGDVYGLGGAFFDEPVLKDVK